jgi:hypothetical protein
MEHKASECPLKGVPKAVECFHCGGPHQKNHCPSLPRVVYSKKHSSVPKVLEKKPLVAEGETNEKKQCFVCSSTDHFAKSCTRITTLHSQMETFISERSEGEQFYVNKYNQLLADCARCLEFQGAVYLFKCLREDGVEPDEHTWKILVDLHSKGSADRSRLKCLPHVERTPKKALAEMVRLHLAETRLDKSKEHVPRLAELWQGDAEQLALACAAKNRFKLASVVARQLSLTGAASRALVSQLCQAGWVKETKKGKELGFAVLLPEMASGKPVTVSNENNLNTEAPHSLPTRADAPEPRSSSIDANIESVAIAGKNKKPLTKKAKQNARRKAAKLASGDNKAADLPAITETMEPTTATDGVEANVEKNKKKKRARAQVEASREEAVAVNTVTPVAALSAGADCELAGPKAKKAKKRKENLE